MRNEGDVMQNSYEKFTAEQSEIQGQVCHRGLVAVPKFGDVCKVLWPRKPAAHIAAIAGRDERTAKRWLSGEFEPPVAVVIAVLQKMFER